MKTYTEEERLKRGYLAARNPNHWSDDEDEPVPYSCWCTRNTPDGKGNFAITAYKECENCFGRGVRPIPARDLGMK